MQLLTSYKPISKDLFLKIGLLKSMMYCGVLWGLYKDGWAMTRHADDTVFPFWLSPTHAEYYAKEYWPNYSIKKIYPKDFNDALLPTLKRLDVIPALYTSKGLKFKLTTTQMSQFFFSNQTLHFI